MSRLGLLLAAAIGLAASPAAAATHALTCNGTTVGQLANLIASGAVVTGDVVAIKGICVGDVAIANSITLTNHSNSSALVTTDGIEGELSAGGGNILAVNGLLLEGHKTDTGVLANLRVTRASYVQLENSKVAASQRDGIWIESGGTVKLVNLEVHGIGVANVPLENDGVRATEGGILTDAAPASKITANAGFGVRCGSVNLNATTVTDNGIGEIATFDSGDVNLSSPAQVIAASTAKTEAIQAFSSAHIQLYGAKVSGPAGGILAANGSSIVMVNATVTTTSATVPAVEAASSAMILAGGNTISSTGKGGIAIKVARNGSLTQLLSSRVSGETDAADAVTGAGLVSEGSLLDLGTGLLSGKPSITWTGGITASENSNVKLEGGVAITGALTLETGANGLFYLANGGSNQIVGKVTCPTGGPAPNSHVANPSEVVPAVTIGSATPACLAY